MPDLRDHVCGRHNKVFRDCGCLDKIAKDLHVLGRPVRLKTALARPCPNCGRKWTTDPGCTVFCSCACQVVYNTDRKR